MATVVAPPAAIPEQRVILPHVSWETYERLLEDLDPSRGIRLAYDGEQLEIMVLSLPHEHPSRVLAAIIDYAVLAAGVNIRRVGSTTLKRSDLFKGIEPDSAFYFRNANRIRGKRELSFPEDPPPDLVLEVDISRQSLNKFPIFAAMGVPEVWRWDGERALIYRLTGGTYREVLASVELPPLTSEGLTMFVRRESEMDNPDWAEMIQSWVRERMMAKG